MAQLKNIHAFTENTNGQNVTVGHNRQVKNTGTKLICSLHGNIVLTFDKKRGTLKLDTCGWLKPTTMKAMRDFASFIPEIGFIGASTAGGKFSARVKGEDYVSSNNRTITASI